MKITDEVAPCTIKYFTTPSVDMGETFLIISGTKVNMFISKNIHTYVHVEAVSLIMVDVIRGGIINNMWGIGVILFIEDEKI